MLASLLIKPLLLDLVRDRPADVREYLIAALLERYPKLNVEATAVRRRSLMGEIGLNTVTRGYLDPVPLLIACDLDSTLLPGVQMNAVTSRHNVATIH